MTKILVIGQAPPAVKQGVPYDTTMFYDWLAEIGITKEQAQNLFEFEAVYNNFPGYGVGGHKPPTDEQMDDYWDNSLREKVLSIGKIWVMGRVAFNFLFSKAIVKEILGNGNCIYSMHPSKRNFDRYIKEKDKLLDRIRIFINS